MLEDIGDVDTKSTFLPLAEYGGEENGSRLPIRVSDCRTRACRLGLGRVCWRPSGSAHWEAPELLRGRRDRRGYWSSQGRVEKGWNWVAECNNIGERYTRKNVLFLRWRGERYIPKNVFFLR